jgi:hypothetical protein
VRRFDAAFFFSFLDGAAPGRSNAEKQKRRQSAALQSEKTRAAEKRRTPN